MGTILDFARLVSSSVDALKQAVVASLEGPGGETASEGMFGALGVLVRPRTAQPTNTATGLRPAGAAETIVGRLANRLVPLAWRDLRLNQRAGALQEGDVVLAHYDGGMVHLRATAGGGTQVVVYAPTLNGSGAVTKAHAITLDPQGNTVQIQHADGPAVFVYSDKVVLKNAGGNVYAEVGATEIVLNGPVKITGGLTVGNPLTAIPVDLTGDVPSTLIRGN